MKPVRLLCEVENPLCHPSSRQKSRNRVNMRRAAGRFARLSSKIEPEFAVTQGGHAILLNRAPAIVLAPSG